MAGEPAPPLTECSEKYVQKSYLCSVIGQKLETLPASFCTTVHLENAQHELLVVLPRGSSAKNKNQGFLSAA